MYYYYQASKLIDKNNTAHIIGNMFNKLVTSIYVSTLALDKDPMALIFFVRDFVEPLIRNLVWRYTGFLSMANMFNLWEIQSKWFNFKFTSKYTS